MRDRYKNPAPALIIVVVTAIALLLAATLSDNKHHDVHVALPTNTTNTTMPEGPEPMARMVEDVFVQMGMSESSGSRRLLQEDDTAFSCAVYRQELCDGSDTCDLLVEQQYALCELDSDDPLRQGPVSQCVCGEGEVSDLDPEDQAVLDSVVELGYEHEEVDEFGNVVTGTSGTRSLLGRRRRRRSARSWSIPRCRSRMCPGGGRNCRVAKVLRKIFCKSDGTPRNPNSQLALAICDAPPEPPVTPCEPGTNFPVVIHGGRNRQYYDDDSVNWDGFDGPQVADLQITQGASSIGLHLSSDEVCFSKVKIFAGTSRPGTRPAQYSPVLPGTFPTDDYSVTINVNPGSGPETIGYNGHYPWQWNHPHSPAFDCEDNIKLLIWAKTQDKNADGSCPAVNGPGWKWAWAKSSIPSTRYNGRRAEGYIIKYRFCCQGGCCQTGNCVPDTLERDCVAPAEYQGNFSSCAGVQCPVTCDGEVRVSIDSSVEDNELVLSASASGGSGSYTYEWFLDGNSQGSATSTNTFVVSIPDGYTGAGDITVVARDAVDECGAQTSAPFRTDCRVNQIRQPQPDTLPPAFSNIGTRYFVINRLPFYDYQWSFQGNDVDELIVQPGDTITPDQVGLPYLLAQETGTYVLTITPQVAGLKDCEFSTPITVTCEGFISEVVLTQEPVQDGTKLTAMVTGGSPNNAYRVFRDGQQVIPASGAQSFDSSAMPFMVTVSEPGEYRVEVFSDQGCNEANVRIVSNTVTVEQLCDGNTDVAIEPSVEPNQLGKFPFGASISLAAQGLGGSAPYTYLWNKDGDFFSTEQTISNLEMGSYEVIVMSSDPLCGMAVATYMVMFAPDPNCPGIDITVQIEAVVDGTMDPVTGPVNEGVNLRIVPMIIGGTPNPTVEWSLQGNAGFVVQTDGNDAIVNAAGVYVVTVTDVDDRCGVAMATFTYELLPKWCCQRADQVNVGFDAQPTGRRLLKVGGGIGTTPPPPFECVEQETNPAGGEFIACQASTTCSPGDSCEGTGACCALTGGNGVCNPDTLNIECDGPNNNFLIGASCDDTEPCLECQISVSISVDQDQLEAQPAGEFFGSVAYEWSGPGLTNPLPSTPSIQPQVDGSYTVVVEDSITGCVAMNTVDFVVPCPPEPTVSITAGQIPEGAFPAVSLPSGFTLTWTPESPPFLTTGDKAYIVSSISRPECTYPGVFTVETIECINGPLAFDGFVQDPNPVNEGDTVSVTANVVGGSGSPTFVWTEVPSVDSGLSSQISVTMADDATYEVTITDGACGTTVESYTLGVTPDLVCGAIQLTSGSQPFTAGDVISLSVSSVGGLSTFSYAWNATSNGNPVTFSDPALQMPTITVTGAEATGQPIEISVTVSDLSIPTQTCSAELSVQTVAPVVCDLAVTISPTAQVVISGDPATLTANPTGVNTPFSYLWSTGATTRSITVNPTADTTYTVTVSDSEGICPDTSAQSTVIVRVEPTGACCTLEENVLVGNSDIQTSRCEQTTEEQCTGVFRGVGSECKGQSDFQNWATVGGTQLNTVAGVWDGPDYCDCCPTGSFFAFVRTQPDENDSGTWRISAACVGEQVGINAQNAAIDTSLFVPGLRVRNTGQEQCIFAQIFGSPATFFDTSILTLDVFGPGNSILNVLDLLDTRRNEIYPATTCLDDGAVIEVTPTNELANEFCDPVTAVDGFCCRCGFGGNEFCSETDRSSEICGREPCIGAVCGDIGTLVDITFTCVANTECTDPCTIPDAPLGTGACCLQDGTCENILGPICAAAGGAFGGGDSRCESSQCLLADFVQACCIDNLSTGNQQCQTITESECQQFNTFPSLNTQSLGVGTVCIDGATCPAPAVEEACCSPIGCFDVSTTFCGANGGVSQGPGTTCADTNVCAAGPPDFTCPTASVSGASLTRAADTQVSYAALEDGRVASCTVTLGSQDLSLRIADIDGANEVTTTTVDVFRTAPSGSSVGNLVKCIGVGNRLFVLLNSAPNLDLYEFSTFDLSHPSNVSVLSGTTYLHSIVDVDANPRFAAFVLRRLPEPVYGVIDLETTLVTTFDNPIIVDPIGVAVDQDAAIYAVEFVPNSSGGIFQIAKYVEGGSVQVETIENANLFGIAYSTEKDILLVSLVQPGRTPTSSIALFDRMLAPAGTLTDATTGGSMSAPVVIETSPSSAFALAMRWPTQGTGSVPAAFIIDLTASPPTSVRVDSPGFVNGVSSISTTDALSVSSDGLGVFFAASAGTEPSIFACDGAYLDSNEYP
jgi:hypothetical protein